jgi:hypothetical protein
VIDRSVAGKCDDAMIRRRDEGMVGYRDRDMEGRGRGWSRAFSRT